MEFPVDTKITNLKLIKSKNNLYFEGIPIFIKNSNGMLKLNARNVNGKLYIGKTNSSQISNFFQTQSFFFVKQSNKSQTTQPNIDIPTQPNIDIPTQPKLDIPTHPNLDILTQPNVDILTQRNLDIQIPKLKKTKMKSYVHNGPFTYGDIFPPYGTGTTFYDLVKIYNFFTKTEDMNNYFTVANIPSILVYCYNINLSRKKYYPANLSYYDLVVAYNSYINSQVLDTYTPPTPEVTNIANNQELEAVGGSEPSVDFKDNNQTEVYAKFVPTYDTNFEITDSTYQNNSEYLLTSGGEWKILYPDVSDSILVDQESKKLKYTYENVGQISIDPLITGNGIATLQNSIVLGPLWAIVAGNNQMTFYFRETVTSLYYEQLTLGGSTFFTNLQMNKYV